MGDLQIKKLSCEFFIVMSFVKAINREVKKKPSVEKVFYMEVDKNGNVNRVIYIHIVAKWLKNSHAISIFIE